MTTARENFNRLAAGLYYGGLDADKIQFKLSPTALQDIEHHKYRMRLEAQRGIQAMYEYMDEVFDGAEIPGVIVWEKR